MKKIKDYVFLGTCKKPHGIKGAFSLFLESEKDSILKKGFKVLLVPMDKNSDLREQGEELTIQSISFGNKTILYFQEISNRNECESLIPFYLYCHRNDFPKLEDDEYYLSDLVGFKAKTPQKILGRVERFYSNGVQDIAVIKGSRIYELPLVKSFISEINWENQEIIFQEFEEVSS